MVLCCCAKGDDEPDLNASGEVVAVDQIAKDRKCTDLLFLIIFAAFWVGMLAVGITGFTDGDVNRLLYGIDYHANLCGVSTNGSDPDFGSRDQLFYYDLASTAESLSGASSTSSALNSISVSSLRSVCVNGCPSDYIPYSSLMSMVSIATVAASVSTSDTAMAAAMATISATYEEYLDDKYFICEYYKYTNTSLSNGTTVPDDWDSQYFSSLSDSAKISSIKMSDGPCYPTYMKYSDFLNYCVPAIPTEMTEYFEGSTAATTGAPTATGTTASPTATGTTGAPTASPTTVSPTATGETPSPTAAADATSPYAEASFFTQLKALLNYITDARDVLETYVTDLYKAWAVVLVAGVVGGVVLSMGWMTVLRYMAGCMAWTTVLIVNLLFLVIALFCALKADLISGSMIGGPVGDTVSGVDTNGITDPSEADQDAFKVATYVTAVFAGLCVLFTLLMFKRIRVAVAVIKVASQAVGAMPMILFFPLVQLLMLIALIVWWLAVMAMLYSAGDVTEKDTGGYNLSWDDTLRYMMLYHIFGLLWTNQFIVGYGIMVIAGAIANFYWTGGDRKLMPASPILGAMRRTCRYHLGSIALGSFLVAVIQFVRLILEYIDRKTKDMQEANPIYKYALCCVKCCMWYLEKIMKFINRNAYIMVAVKGQGFCRSATTAIKLLIDNALRLAAVNVVGDSLIWLGKIVVMLAAGVIAFFMTDLDIYTDPAEKTYLSSPILPIIFSMILAYFIAEVFFQVYEMSIDTILLSFCEDAEKNGEAKYAPKLLMDAIGQSREANNRKVESAESDVNMAPAAQTVDN